MLDEFLASELSEPGGDLIGHQGIGGFEGKFGRSGWGVGAAANLVVPGIAIDGARATAARRALHFVVARDHDQLARGPVGVDQFGDQRVGGLVSGGETDGDSVVLQGTRQTGGRVLGIEDDGGLPQFRGRERLDEEAEQTQTGAF